ncbi:hypothetical protein NOCARDAX2BIS_490089 [Nocardioides sp. AX2bis]|nr:hypothetical protein NOCARDAX2BIS_490089 [Nocardioides sp. AX2bis]
MGHRADRRVLPLHPDPGLRCRGAARHQHARPGRQPRRTPPRRGGGRWSRHDRRRHPARPDRGGRLRHHPGRGRRPDADVLGVGGARRLQQRVQEGHGHREGGDPGDPDRRGRHRPGGDPPGHPGPEPEHRVPGGAGLRGRRVGEPADDPAQHLLAPVQHPRCPVEHLRRAHRQHRAGDLLPGDVGQDRPGLGREPVPAARRHRHLLVPAGEPGPGLDPARLPLRHHRGPQQPRAGRRGPLHRARGARADRRGLREGDQPLTDHHRCIPAPDRQARGGGGTGGQPRSNLGTDTVSDDTASQDGRGHLPAPRHPSAPPTHDPPGRRT